MFVIRAELKSKNSTTTNAERRWSIIVQYSFIFVATDQVPRSIVTGKRMQVNFGKQNNTRSSRLETG